MRRAGAYLALAAAVGVLGWLMPPFHVVPLRQAQTARAQGVFKPSDYAEKFWRERLTPGLTTAADATQVLDALAQDPAAAARKFGRTVGASDTALFFVAGTGTVVSLGDKGVGISLRSANSADVLLRIGMLFGNTVRDATGLLDVSKFANSQDFNAISAELNRIVETRIVPQLKARAQPGVRLHVTAVFEVEAESEINRPLPAIPLAAEVVFP